MNIGQVREQDVEQLRVAHGRDRERGRRISAGSSKIAPAVTAELPEWFRARYVQAEFGGPAIRLALTMRKLPGASWTIRRLTASGVRSVPRDPDRNGPGIGSP